jgi:HEAT repeat protein
MILGKYRAAAAVAAVVTCLRDPDAEVRRSAAVAVSEWDVMPPAARAEILRLTGDANVHVRRVASSMLPEILGGRFGMAEGMILSDREAPAMGGPRAPVGETADILNRALGDEDVTVRRNVLTAARYLPGVLRQEALAPALQDPDREVRVLAVQSFAQLRGDEAGRGQVLAALAADADSTVRREVAGALGRLGESGFGGLERLAADPDAGVRSRAVRELVQLQHPRGLELIERSVADDAIPADERRSLLVYVGFYGEDARPLLTRLSTDRSVLLRAEAIRGLSRLSGAAGGGAGFLVPCLEDESIEVRRAAAQGLTQWLSSRRSPATPAPWPTDADLARLQASPFADVRLLAVRLASMLPPEARVGVLADACLDDDTPVRCEAILHLALLGTPAALDLVARSLEDPEAEVALAAVRALAMRPSAQSRQWLQAFHDRCPDGAVKATVADVLAELSGGGPARVRPLRPAVPRGIPGERVLPQRLRPVQRPPGTVPPPTPGAP